MRVRRPAAWILLGAALAVSQGCGPKRVTFAGPGHDFDWPVEAPDAPAYESFLKAKQLSNEGEVDAAIAELKKALRVDARSPYLHFALAVEYAKKNDLVQAEGMGRTAVSLDPKFRNAHYLLGKIHAARAEWDKGEAAFKKVVELDQEDPTDGTVALASLYVESKRPDQAVGLLRGLIEKDRSNVLAYYYLGRVYTELNRMDEAIATYEAAMKVNPTFTVALKAIALIHQYMGRSDKAAQAFREVLEIEPDNNDIRDHLGQIYLEREEFDAAQKEYELVVAQDPGDTTARLRLGLIYLKKEMFEPAERTFAQLLKDMPNLDQVRYYLAIAREKLKDDAGARRLLGEIRSPESPVYVEARLALAFLHENGGDLRKAERVLRSGVSAKPESGDLKSALAAVLVKLRRVDEAISLLETALQKDPKDESLWVGLAEAYDKQGNLKKTVECLRRAIEINPDNANALNYLGYTFAEKGINLAEAEQLIRRALEIKPKDGYITDSLGWVLFQQGQFPKAREKLEEAMRLAPDEPVILEHYGDTMMKLGDTKRAKEYYERAHGLSKDDVEKTRIEKKLRDLPRP